MKISKLHLAIFVICSFGVPWATAQQSTSKADLKCGSYCLFVALNSLNVPVGNFETLEKTLGQPTNMGYSIYQLCDATTKLNTFSLAVETNLPQLESRKGKFACIALLEKTGHYVCIYDIDDQNVFIVDPPEKRVIPRDTFLKLWNGKAILLSDKPIELQSSYDSNLITNFIYLLTILITIIAIRSVLHSVRKVK